MGLAYSFIGRLLTDDPVRRAGGSERAAERVSAQPALFASPLPRRLARSDSVSLCIPSHLPLLSISPFAYLLEEAIHFAGRLVHRSRPSSEQLATEHLSLDTQAAAIVSVHP